MCQIFVFYANIFFLMSARRSRLKSNLSRLKRCSSSQHSPNISLSSFQSSSLARCVFVCRPLCQRSCLYKATESWIIDAGCSSQYALSHSSCPAPLSLALSLPPPLSSSPASSPVIVIVVVARVNNHQKQKHKSQTRPEKQKERKWGERQRDGRADWSEAMW